MDQIEAKCRAVRDFYAQFLGEENVSYKVENGLCLINIKLPPDQLQREYATVLAYLGPQQQQTQQQQTQ
jgi:hypothetical protein